MDFDVLQVFQNRGGLLQGHFVLKSGRHSGQYFDKDVVVPHVVAMRRLGLELANLATEKNLLPVDVVCGPESVGAKLAQWVATALTPQLAGPLALSAEKVDKPLPGDPLFRIRPGQLKQLCKPAKECSVLLVEDVVTTGGSIFAVKDMLQFQHGMTVVGIVALVNRSGQIFPCLWSLGSAPAVSYTPENCPLCAEGVPINTEVGHGGKPA